MADLNENIDSMLEYEINTQIQVYKYNYVISN